MKPSKLTICGINSYVTPQTVDFNKLAEGNLFGIFGATGSGKSTILDSIVIALYGTSDRDNLSNIINVNCTDAYIKFEFELERNGEVNLFEVARNFKVRPSGLNSGANLINKTTNQTLGDSTDKVNSVIEAMLGISKREFLKCVALPQNEFDQFLLDTPAERKKSVAKLFNLDHFGEDLNRKVKTRLDILNAKQLALTEQLKTFDELSEENQKKLEVEIFETKKVVTLLLKQIDDLQFELNDLDKKYTTSVKLSDAKRNLSDINSREVYFLALKISIDTYNNNKDNLQKFALMRDKLIKLDDVNERQKVAKFELEHNTDKLNKLDAELSDLKDKQNLLSTELNVFKLSLEKKKLLMREIDENNAKVKSLKEQHSKNLDALLIIDERERKVNARIKEVLAEIDLVNQSIKENDRLINKFHEVMLLSESEGFVEKLNDLKYGINQTNLEEVEDYRVHRDILNLVAKINKYVNVYNNKLIKRDELTAELGCTVENLQHAQKELIKTQNSLSSKLNELNKKHNDLYASNIAYNLDENNLKEEVAKLKSEILALNQETKNHENAIKEFDSLKDCSTEINDLIVLIEESENRKVELMQLVAKNNSTIKALEVEQKYLNDEVETIKSEIPAGFDIGAIESEINESNYEQHVADLNNFEKQQTYFQTLVESLEGELGGVSVDVKLVEEKRETLQNLTNQLNEAKVKLGIDETNFENNNKLLVRQNEIETELHLVNTDLRLTQKLASYISKNALVDFVSEEYLYLISEYANKFIYSISRGKYMLKYSAKNVGEFVAVDNFNGGALRSIKTLSGGERFIFSLGLALGVSQSIAVNNNKSFNFFFIDEGFGNLSDDYIEDVLNCFDSLIKLDFTVGFISHVEKMQEYITNKVIVKKDSNDEGTIIEQYFN